LAACGVNGILRHWVLPTACTVILIAPAVHANVGLPMIAVEVPLMAFAIIPIIFIEGWVLHVATRVPSRECISVAKVANIVSTVVGIPLTWATLVIIQFSTGGTQVRGLDVGMARLWAVTWQGAWLMPSRYEMHWMVPSALLFLQIPFFAVSCATEYWVSARRLKTQPRDVVLRAVLIGNAITYGLLMLFATYLLATAKPTHW